ncbi:MAG: PQQ-dependent sugar dehydrogenase [Promethearchaeota archaeon]
MNRKQNPNILKLKKKIELIKKVIRDKKKKFLYVILIELGIIIASFLVVENFIIAKYEIEKSFPYLKFNNPVGIYNADDGSDRLFVLEQEGIIHVFENDADVKNTKIFLDIRNKVSYGGEMGLLGLAFHPDYEINGYLYVDYTSDNPRRTIISRFKVDQNDPNQANRSSEKILLEIEQPYPNHNGGQIAFGPDGNLYISMGDGGSAGDPEDNAQDRRTLLGAILRIDIDSSFPYAIPKDNPFKGNLKGYREEIYAYGLRNPWRFSFDIKEEWLWAADVGQNKYEEINIIKKGKNYGWNIKEGYHCYDAEQCDEEGLEDPIYEYDHDIGHSITGGYVYRGENLPKLVGKYIYGDYEYGQIWSLLYDGNTSPINRLLIDTDLEITSFGVDEDNELYICAFDGRIYSLQQT